jgi:hypothetical protein
MKTRSPGTGAKPRITGMSSTRGGRFSQVAPLHERALGLYGCRLDVGI